MRLGGQDSARFRLLKELGAGGMGVVFLARDEQLRRTVALKFLRYRTSPADAALLRQEARTIAQLDHENIVRIFDVSEWNPPDGGPSVPFIVMEYLEGESLGALLRREQPEPRKAFAIVGAVAAGLAHAHQRHVVHRDLKPNNVFLTRDGKVKLLDFGLAHFTERDFSTFQSFPLAGTPGYMAPEQWLGQQQDERTDIWAAGMLLYELLTGKPLHPQTDLAELRAAVLSPGPVPSIRELHPELPEAVDRLLAHALASAPARRLQSALELHERLAELSERLKPRLEREASSAQHRQVTLLACRLAGLSGQLEADELNELAATFQQGCVHLLSRHGCSVTLGVGDEVLACFGYPVAHEDDSERASRAGLELVHALPARLQQDLPHLSAPELAVRVGIHTGPAVLDDTAPHGATMPVISGEAPKLAAWLTGQAAPNEVLLSEQAYQLVFGSFSIEPLGSRTFEGLAGRSLHLGLYRLLGERRTRLRFHRKHVVRELPALVGREPELKHLLELWDRARRGQGTLVLLRGEAGIGKSRLLQELCARGDPDKRLRLQCQCWPQFSSSAFYPVIEQLRRLFGFEDQEPPERKLQKLEERLNPLGLLPEHVDLIALFLGLPLAEDSPLLLLAPNRRKEKTFEALAALLLRLAAERPLLLVIEDLHWADPSTLELLGFVLERLRSARVLFALSARPEFQAPWSPHPSFPTLTLERLSPEHTATLARQVAREQELSEETVAQLVTKTDGVPLFVEELTHMVLEQPSTGRPPSHALSSIPITLNELLLARLDQLTPRQKNLAQLCAVVGRSCPRRLLSLLWEGEEAALERDLAGLEESGLLLRERTAEPGYQFRHALIQDAAYQSLLRGQRRQYHHRVARLLEERLPQVVQEQPELIAHHYTEAGDSAPAIPYWAEAGEHASRRSAYREAIDQFERGLRLLGTLPDSPQRAEQELRLRVGLGIPLVETRGYGSPEAERTYTRAWELVRQVGDRLPRLGLTTWGLFSYFYAHGQLREARELGVLNISLGQRQRSPEWLVLGHRMVAAIHLSTGNFTAGRASIECALAACAGFTLEQRRALAIKHWLDPVTTARAYATMIYSLTGHLRQARHQGQEALRMAEELAHPNTSAFVLTYVAQSHKLRREVQDALELSTRAMHLSQEHHFGLWLSWSTMFRGWALAELGQWQEGLQLMRTILARWVAAGMRISPPHFLSMIAHVHLKQGQLQEGLDAVAEGLRWEEETGEYGYDAGLRRLQGELLRHMGDEAEATRCFLQAIDVARRQGARLLELRSAVSLGRQLQEQGRPEEAHSLLSRCYEGFEPGLDSPDLRDARDLLASASAMALQPTLCSDLEAPPSG
jgi:class 3 adenylate cyclase/tetratricopeptide (TPR) repeat protein/predicted Ser/Thr protein kinase